MRFKGFPAYAGEPGSQRNLKIAFHSADESNLPEMKEEKPL